MLCHSATGEHASTRGAAWAGGVGGRRGRAAWRVMGMGRAVVRLPGEAEVEAVAKIEAEVEAEAKAEAEAEAEAEAGVRVQAGWGLYGQGACAGGIDLRLHGAIGASVDGPVRRVEVVCPRKGSHA